MAKTLTIGTVSAQIIGNAILVSYTVSSISGTFYTSFPAGTTEQQIRDRMQIIIDYINSVDDTTLLSSASTLHTALNGDPFL